MSWAIRLRYLRGLPKCLLVRFWQWSAKWPWYTALFCAALGVIAMGEYALSILFLFLSALGVFSKTFHSDKLAIWSKIVASMLIWIVFAWFTYSINAERNGKPWSHLQVLAEKLAPNKKSLMRVEIFPPPSRPKFWDNAKPKSEYPKPNPASITVEIGNSLNPRSALETRFILTNHNPAVITNIWYSCEVRDEGHGMVYATRDQAEDLPPGFQRSLSCDMVEASVFVDAMRVPILNLTLYFTYKNKKERKIFRFGAMRDRDGIFKWFPAGAGQEYKPE